MAGRLNALTECEWKFYKSRCRMMKEGVEGEVSAAGTL